MCLCDYDRDRVIASAEPIPVDLRTALDEFDRLSGTDRCFIGFVRSDGETLQFAWNDDGTLSADIPFPATKSSLARRGTREGLRPLIETFAGGVPVRELPDFHLQAWS
jgi:hypothetical protein